MFQLEKVMLSEEDSRIGNKRDGGQRDGGPIAGDH